MRFIACRVGVDRLRVAVHLDCWHGERRVENVVVRGAFGCNLCRRTLFKSSPFARSGSGVACLCGAYDATSACDDGSCVDHARLGSCLVVAVCLRRRYRRLVDGEAFCQQADRGGVWLVGVVVLSVGQDDFLGLVVAVREKR